MRNFVPIQPVGRVSLTATEQGLAIVIPTYLLVKAQSTSKFSAIGRIGILLFSLMGWGMLGLFSLQGLRDSVSYGSFAGVVAAGAWCGVCASMEIMGGMRLVEMLFGKEKIVFSGTVMTINDYLPVRLRWRKSSQDALMKWLWWRTTTRYELAKISRVGTAVSGQRVLPYRMTIKDVRPFKDVMPILVDQNVAYSCLTFDYGGVTVRCGQYLNDAEARQLAQSLSDIITFHCHTVECIVFGTPASPVQDAPMTLHNPDVTELSFPFVRLQQISIYAETYDFYLVERFITYAVNFIGQDYLREHVEVRIYGDPEQVPPNLRNSLTNLCKEVHVHE